VPDRKQPSTICLLCDYMGPHSATRQPLLERLIDGRWVIQTEYAAFQGQLGGLRFNPCSVASAENGPETLLHRSVAMALPQSRSNRISGNLIA